MDSPSLTGHNWVRLLGKLLLKSWLAWSHSLLPSLPALLPLRMWIWWPDYVSRFLIMRWFWGSKLWDQAERTDSEGIKNISNSGATDGDLGWLNLDLFYEKKSCVLSSLNYFGFLLYVIIGVYVPWGQESLPVIVTGISQRPDLGIQEILVLSDCGVIQA